MINSWNRLNILNYKKFKFYFKKRFRWSKYAPLSEARAHASMFVALNDVYIVGGAGKIRNDKHSMSSIEIWDPNTRTWKYETEMAIPRYGHSTGSIGKTLQSVHFHLHEILFESAFYLFTISLISR